MQNRSCKSWPLPSDYLKYSKLYRETAYATSIVNGILMLPNIGLNGIIIITILRTQSLRNASNWFLGNLMLTDLLMGLCAQPLFIVSRIYRLKGIMNCDLNTSERFFANTLPLTLMLTLTASSLDRYLAIRLMLQYRAKMTSFRAIIVIITLWVFSVGLGCLISILGRTGFTTFLGIVFLICLIVTFISYFKAYHGLKQHQNKVSSNENNTCINVKKYQRSFATMLCVFLLQLVFYTPDIFAKFMEHTSSPYLIVILIADTIVYINATLNPVFFLWRMRDVRRACKKTVNKILGK